MGVGARDHHVAGLDRLAQGFQHGARVFRKLVEKEHPVMRKADLARFRAAPAADDRRHGGRVMRGAIRSGARNAAFVQKPGE